jgi:hypothetical protein
MDQQRKGVSRFSEEKTRERKRMGGGGGVRKELIRWKDGKGNKARWRGGPRKLKSRKGREQRETSIGTLRGHTLCGQPSVLVGTIQARNKRANHKSRNVRITRLQVLTATEESGRIKNKGKQKKEVVYDNDVGQG